MDYCSSRSHPAKKCAKAEALVLPGRIACLETSFAAVLSLGIRGRTVDWSIGVAATPYSSHAWIAAEGRPAAELPEIEAVYRPLLVI